MLDELVNDFGQIPHSHKDNERVRSSGQFVPGDPGFALVRGLVPGDDSKRRSHPAMREGNARVGRNGRGRSHSWHHFKRNSVPSQNAGFLTAPSQHKRVAPFQSDDDLPIPVDNDGNRAAFRADDLVNGGRHGGYCKAKKKFTLVE